MQNQGDVEKGVEGLKFLYQNMSLINRIQSWFSSNSQKDLKSNYGPPLHYSEGDFLLDKNKSAYQKEENQKSADKENISSDQRLRYFFVFVIISFLSFFGAMLYLPIILLSPYNFAILFSLGNISAHFAIAFTYDSPNLYLTEVYKRKENIPFAILYLVSLVLTIYYSFINTSYVLVLAFSCVQFTCVLWFLASYVPGAKEELRSVFSKCLERLRPRK